MRALNLIALAAFFIVIGFVVYVAGIEPVAWYRTTKRDSIRILQAARTRADLTNAVGDLGLFISLTNNQWVAIRYRDAHGLVIRSSAVALDSGGQWFESDHHFCGSLSFWPILKDEIAEQKEQRRLTPQMFSNQVPLADSDNGFYRIPDMLALDTAPDLESARRALNVLSFKQLK